MMMVIVTTRTPSRCSSTCSAFTVTIMTGGKVKAIAAVAAHTTITRGGSPHHYYTGGSPHHYYTGSK